MKHKLIHFCVAMGLPLTSCLGNGGCTGVCGQCNFSCSPGVLMLLFLLGKILYKKICVRIGCHAEQEG